MSQGSQTPFIPLSKGGKGGFAAWALPAALAAGLALSFAVPAFGFKLDAIPGRLNEMWFRADREGVYRARGPSTSQSRCSGPS